MGPRLRAEIALVLILVMGVSSLFVVRGRQPGRSPGQTLAELFATGDLNLECLKRVAEGDFNTAPGPVTVRTADVARRVQEVRGLTFDRIPEPTYISSEELSRRAAGFAEDYPEEEALADGAMLTDLGAVEEGTDLKELTEQTLGEQVAGYYDPGTKELVVTGDPDAGLMPEEELTLAHELVHALTDEQLGLPDLDEVRDGAEDAALAATALVEGDATLSMTIYSIEGAFTGSFMSLLGTVLALGGAPEAGPHHLQRSFLFPYSEGVGFVCGLYERGGWGAVSAAYDEPPVTTAQVLFPDRYPSELAVPPRGSGSPGPGWELADVDAMGAADLLFLFEAPGDDVTAALEDPRDRAAAWAGGEAHLWVWRDGFDTATALVLVQRPGERSLCRSMMEWYRAAFPEDAVMALETGERLAVESGIHGAALRCEGQEVRLGIAQDLATARRLIA